MSTLRCLSVLACALAQAPTQDNPAPAQPAAPSTTKTPMKLTDADAHLLGTATQGLAKALWGKLASGNDNVAFSPGSIAVALAMTAAGARGETQQQMLRVLHLENPDALAGFGPLCARWESGGGVKIAVANRLFGARQFPFEKEYLGLVERSFKAPLELLDYVGNPEGVRAHINAWVLERTAQRIKDLLPPGSITKEARLTLVNAVHFLGDWLQQFKNESTHDADFTLADGSKKKIKMMQGNSSYEFAELGGCEVVQMPYVGKEFAMLFVLPPKEAAAGSWLPDPVLAAAAELPSERVSLSLPRFSVEASDSTRLKGPLIELGMPLAFDRMKADFTGIANPRDPQDRLLIDEVYHKAFVRVDEKGTEAAAATAVVMKRAGSAARPARVVRFDRPFAFVLRHVPSGTPLFVGKVMDPGAGVARN